jgi:hypothetical protein
MLLTRNDFTDNAPNYFRQLWEDQHFTDVTLATADNRQIKTHKVIISLCSTFFKRILIRNPHKNPLIYLKGIEYKYLESIMKFIYLGQCHVENNEYQDLLQTAKDLEIIGLKEEAIDNGTAEIVVNSPSSQNTDTYEYPTTENAIKFENEVKTPKDHLIKTTEIDQQETFQKGLNIISKRKGTFECNLCGKIYEENGTLKVHIMSKHDGIRYDCNECDYKATQRTNLTKHKQSKHEGVRYSCDQCVLQFTDTSSMNKHKRAKHEGIRYTCGFCDGQFNQKFELTLHTKNKHKGIKYYCDQCESQFNHQSSLTKHKQTVHDGVRYSCSVCDFQAIKRSTLLKHMIVH